MTRTIQYLSLMIMVCLLGAAPTLAAPQDPEPDDPPRTEGEAVEAEEEDGNRRGGRDGEDTEGIQPYDEVITDEAVSDEGVFLVHQIDDSYYYEIPESEFGREFLWVARIARTIAGQGYGGQKFDTRVVRWERRGERVFLRNVSYEIVADESLPIAQAVGAANNDTILMAFDIAALGETNPSSLTSVLCSPPKCRNSVRARGSRPGVSTAVDPSWIASCRFLKTSKSVPSTPTRVRRTIIPKGKAEVAPDHGEVWLPAARHSKWPTAHGEATGRADDAPPLR